jgi:tetratricopeptide (TPR) repeat protein
MDADDRIERAHDLYEQAVFAGDPDASASADRALDAVEADVALARGRIMHARFLEQRDADDADAVADRQELVLFEIAARLYEALGDSRGQAEALFWIGTYHQIGLGDDAAALPYLERSLELATSTDDRRTAAEALRHLGISAHRAGRTEMARTRLETAVQLRRELGSDAGVAANLVGLAYLAGADDRTDDALALLDEAAALAEACGAHRVMRSIDEARTDLS